MGKISPVAAKYIVHIQIQIDGIVDKPDVIGAIFGQTEGLLGSDLELRELQRNGKVGRIEVNLDTRTGKTVGEILILSSLDKAETAIVGASLETIQRIGPCNARVRVENIEDVRVSKRTYVVERAKELLKDLIDRVLPDSQEITDEVASSVRVMEIREYGKDRLAAGPAIEESDEIIVVEGRADVLNLLKHGIKNCIAMNGTSVPETIKELSKAKVVTAFVDGDRGGDLILKELLTSADIDYVIRAPAGKEVEELEKKEIHKALRSKVAIEQIKMEVNGKKPQEHQQIESIEVSRKEYYDKLKEQPKILEKKRQLAPQTQRKDLLLFKEMLENLVGTRGAYLLDDNTNILGKVPLTELPMTLRNVNSGVSAIIFDGIINRDVVKIAEKSNIKTLVAMESKVNRSETKVELLTKKDL